MKRSLLFALLCTFHQITYAVSCPTITDVQNTRFDLLIGLDSSRHPTQFDKYSHFATMGHLSHGDKNWYVVAGSFKGANNFNEAVEIGHNFLMKSDNALQLADTDGALSWSCVYYATENPPTDMPSHGQKFVAAFTGKFDKSAYKHLIKAMRRKSNEGENAQRKNTFMAKLKNLFTFTNDG